MGLSANGRHKCQAGKNKDSVRREREGNRGLKESNGGKSERELPCHHSTCVCVCVCVCACGVWKRGWGGGGLLLYSTVYDDDDCFYYHSWRKYVVIAFETLSSFLT